MSTYSFETLITSLKSAVIQAAQATEEQYIRMLERYFTPDEAGVLQPNTVSMSLPSTHRTSDTEATTTYTVPLFSMVPTNTLTMQNIKIEFECAIEGLEGDEDTRLVLSTGRSGSNTTAKITLELTGGDPPECIARINDALLKEYP